MPIPQITRVNYLDLNKNISIGVSLPFNGPVAFNRTYNTKDQIKSNIINLLLTNKGERIMNPNFGSGIKEMIFEGITDNIIPAIKDKIIESVNIYVPQVIIEDIEVTNKPDINTIDIFIRYKLRISGNSDQINIQFQ